MATRALALLEELEALKARYVDGSSVRKRELLAGLDAARLPSADAVARLHEALCFLRAYPDDAALLARVEAMLEDFDRRADLRRFRRTLADSGIAGTRTSYRFYYSTAVWLAERWGERLDVDWKEFEARDMLEGRLHLLALYGETPGLDEEAFALRDWVHRLKGPDETDGAFLVRRFAALDAGPFVRQQVYEELDLPLHIEPGPDTPCRTRARAPLRLPVAYQTGPLDRARPDLFRAARLHPVSVRAVSPAKGRELIDLARAAMVARSRDLDVFAYGDPRDVRLIDAGDGYVFAAIGFVPERRLMLEAVYGFLTLKNGVPIGYVLNSALLGSAELAYNVFETYRGAEAGRVYGKVIMAVRHLFGADTFTIYPYQLGHENMEALESGAWWFYQKLGFRARDPSVLALMERELARMRRDPRHRSSIATLRELAVANVYLNLGREREDVIGLFPLSAVGLAVTDYVAGRFGADRAKAERVCAREAMARFDVRSRAGWSKGENLAWKRWAPLLCLLDGPERWTPAERRAAAAAVRAKGGRRESDYVRRFDAHRKLRRALRRLTSGRGAP